MTGKKKEEEKVKMNEHERKGKEVLNSSSIIARHYPRGGGVVLELTLQF